MAEIDTTVFGPSGVSVANGKVFANKAGKEIAAYDAGTGEEIWATNILRNGGAVNFQPVAADGKVLAATSSLSQPGARGTLFALDQDTGDILWRFDTVESPDLWGTRKSTAAAGPGIRRPSTSTAGSPTGAPPTLTPSPEPKASPTAPAAPETTGGPTRSWL